MLISIGGAWIAEMTHEGKNSARRGDLVFDVGVDDVEDVLERGCEFCAGNVPNILLNAVPEYCCGEEGLGPALVAGNR